MLYPKMLKFVGWTFLCISPILLIVAVTTAINTHRFIKNGIRADGVVTELAQSSGEHGPLASPVVQFKDRNRINHTYRSNLRSSPPAYQVGERVKIIYDPTNPKSAAIHSFDELWLITLIFSILGVVNFGVGLLMIRFGPAIAARFWPGKKNPQTGVKPASVNNFPS